jgi:hypothetical protein
VKNWNVVVSIYQDGFKRALRALRQIGSVERSPFHGFVARTLVDANCLPRQPILCDAIANRASEFQHAIKHLDSDFHLTSATRVSTRT